VLVSGALLLAADRGAEAARSLGAPELPELVRALASSGFADTTRVGGGNPELGTLMARCNDQALLEALGNYRRALDGLEQAVRHGDWSALQTELQTTQRLRGEFL
jgi:arogenate dehydrogenase (NADP+)